ncbi:MAG: hypothetical protein ACKVTZ_09670 [Bacteroidia bacterium]
MNYFSFSNLPFSQINLRLWVILYLFQSYSYGQYAPVYPIMVNRTGHDEVTIINQASHSISVKVGNKPPHLIVKGHSQKINFPLTNQNVRNTTFVINYDKDCFKLDSLLCADKASQIKESAKGTKEFLSELVLLDGTQSDRAVLMIRAFYGFWFSGEALSDLTNEILAILLSNDTEERKLLRLSAITAKCDQKIAYAEAKAENCFTKGRELVSKGFHYSYEATKYIQPQEKAKLELSVYTPLLYRVWHFQGTHGLLGFNNMNTLKKPSYGYRMVYLTNQYDKDKNKVLGIKQMYVLDYLRTPTVYKKMADNTEKSRGYFWDIYSIGLGKEVSSDNPNHLKSSRFGAAMEVGISLCRLHEVEFDTLSNYGNIKNIVKGSKIGGFSPYVNIQLQAKIWQWVAIYGGFNTNIVASYLKYNLRNMPISAQLNV